MALIVVPTPIGNLGDMTERALEVLRTADLILCEDTRHSGPVLARWGVKAAKLSCQKFNERARVEEVLDRLRRGESLALISDAGTPGVSDPGALMVKAVIDAGLDVDVLPGATAFVPALVLSGLPTQPFVFLGFPPDKSAQRLAWLAPWASVPATLIFYLSPHKAARQLPQLSEILGPRDAALCRELTKLHQEVRREPLDQLAQSVGDLRGELCLVVGPPRGGTVAEPDWKPEALALRGEGQTVKDAARLIEQRYGVAKNEVKAYLMSGQGEEE